MNPPHLPKAAFDPLQRGPLEGIRVVDLSRLVAGNMLSLQLADFGADVIKVEEPRRGDTLRHWVEMHPDHPDGFDGWWQVYGRNKRSLAVDLRQPPGMEVLRRLIDGAQVLIESFRPGTLEAMGLAPDDLHARNPGLVVVRLTGWGQTGPYCTLPGFGSLIEAVSGYALRNSPVDQPPQLPNMALADMVCGLTGAFATLAAIREVELRGGRGQVIDLSLLEPMQAIMGADVTNYMATGTPYVRGQKVASPRGVFRCRDGRWLALSGSTDAMARRVFESIGQGHLADDERYATGAARLAHDAEIDALIAAFVAERDLSECLSTFRGQGVTVGPIYGVEQLVQDEHVVERGVYVEAGGVVMHQVTPRLGGTPGGLRRPAPRLGEHTAEIVGDLGLDAVALSQQGVVRCC